MDNRTIDVVSEGDISTAIKLIWANAAGGKASHYKIVNLKENIKYYGEPTTHHFGNIIEDKEGDTTLILLWHDEKEAEKLPFPLDFEGAVSFIKGWLEQVDYGKKPDIDGDCGKGWRVFTEGWGHVAGHHYAIVAVQPIYAMYGK